jgi:hypothetical protein
MKQYLCAVRCSNITCPWPHLIHGSSMYKTSEYSEFKRLCKGFIRTRQHKFVNFEAANVMQQFITYIYQYMLMLHTVSECDWQELAQNQLWYDLIYCFSIRLDTCTWCFVPSNLICHLFWSVGEMLTMPPWLIYIVIKIPISILKLFQTQMHVCLVGWNMSITT